ncbi:MAG TPA: hypothetical protein PLB05_06010 [Candidatus Omnitrophota bacterium]|nr:hypothetical protein [Candidatus Omnitrophota bacterium]
MSAVLKDLGPCQITFDGVDIGKTHGGVTFRDSLVQTEVKEDQAGATPVDHIINGRSIQVEVPMTRSTLAQLMIVLPGASSFGSHIRVCNYVGIQRAAYAKQLIITPLVDGVPQEDSLTIFKASPIPDIELIFDAESQRVYKVIFNAYPDSTKNNGLYQLGGAVV